MGEPAKKPQGWFATEVKRLSEEFERITEEVAAQRALVERLPAVIELSEHPLIVNYKYFENRLKVMEQMQNKMLEVYNKLETQLLRAERAAAALTRYASKGA